MAHNYLIDTYRFIDARMAEARAEAEESGEDSGVRDAAEGRLAMLREIQGYLAAKYDRKLPRRLRGRHGMP